MKSSYNKNCDSVSYSTYKLVDSQTLYAILVLGVNLRHQKDSKEKWTLLAI